MVVSGIKPFLHMSCVSGGVVFRLFRTIEGFPCSWSHAVACWVGGIYCLGLGYKEAIRSCILEKME